MTSKKLYFMLVAAIVILASGLIGGAYGANTLLQAEAKKLVDVRSVSAALDLQQIQLTKAKSNVNKYDSIGKVARGIVPQDKNQALTVRELVAIAQANGISLSSISFPSSTLGAPSAAPAAGTTAKPTTPATSAGPNLSQLTPVKTISGVYILQIIVSSDTEAPIDYEKFTSFLSDLEHNRRTALVSGITITPAPKDPTKVSFTLNIDEYIKP